MRRPLPLCFALAATLALAACDSDTKYVRTGGGGDPAAITAAEARAMAAETALADLQALLTAAQDAQGAGTGAQQRAEARAAVADAREDLADLQQVLPDLTATPAARMAAETALEAVDTALARTAEALAPMAAGTGLLQLASMHSSLEQAQDAIDAAQASLKAALAAEPGTALRNLLIQAQGTLTTAQVSLLPPLRQELADARAEIDRLTMRFGKDLAIDGREASRVTPSGDASVTLTPRRSGVRVATEDSFVATSPSWGIRTDYFLTNYGTASTDRLDIEQDPVPYRANAGMVIPGASGTPSAVEFPGRGQVFRGIGYDNREFYLARQGSYGPTSEPDPADRTAAADIPWIGSSRTGLRANLRGHAISSFQYRADGGLTMKFGGLPPDRNSDGNIDGNEGSLIFGDLEALTAKGTYDCGTGGNQACDEAGTRDLTVSFGAPSRDPSGEPAYHWTVDVPDPRLTIAAGTTADLDRWTRADADGTVGRYQLLLSNHAGVDDKGTAATGDDEERYLRYAAYGLFQFIDYQTTNDRVGRMQTLHYGYDAFGAHNRLPAATADSIAATLKGSTMAWLVGHTNSNVTGLERMRGNVTLHACIGGGGCQASDFTAPARAATPTNANRLTGAIHDLEIALPGGAWGDGNTRAHGGGHDAFGGDLLLTGAIDAAGAFAGVLRPDTMPSDGQWSAADSRADGPDIYGYTLRQRNSNRNMAQYWGNGAIEGVFYGPADALEAAGTWWLPPVRSEVTDNEILGIVGSFGAVADE